MLNKHSKKIQIAQLQRTCYYNDKLQSYDYSHSKKAPKWIYVIRQNMIYDTKVKRTAEENNNSSDDYEEVKIISSKNAKNVESQL